MTLAPQAQFEAAIARQWPAERWCDVTVVVAVSGGPDSVALLRGLHALKKATGSGKLIVAHFNHRLRPDAENDAHWVRSLADSLQLDCEIGTGDVAEEAASAGDGIEAAARAARYRFLQSVAERRGGRYVVTGHTADDQIETVLFNFLRGTGLSGLAAMPHARPLGPAVSLVRPLLAIRRTDVIQYLHRLGQSYLIDPTNACESFARNRIRNELVPFLRDRFGASTEESITRLAQLAAEAQECIGTVADELLDRCLVAPGTAHRSGALLSVSRLANQHRHLVREMFVALWRRVGWPMQNMGYAQWDTLAAMAMTEPPVAPVTLPGNLFACRDEDKLRITPQKKPGDVSPRA